MKTFVMGDLHGSFDALTIASQIINLSINRLFLLGDYVERGSQPIELLNYLIDNNVSDITQPGIHALIGNHDMDLATSIHAYTTMGDDLPAYDEMMYKECITESLNTSLNNIKPKEMENFFNFIQSLPAVIFLEEYKVVLSHASVSFTQENKLMLHNIPNYRLDQHLLSDIVWKREDYYISYDRSEYEKSYMHIIGHTPIQTILPRIPPTYTRTIKPEVPQHQTKPFNAMSFESILSQPIKQREVSPLYSRDKNILIMDTGGVFGTINIKNYRNFEWYFSLIDLDTKELYKIKPNAAEKVTKHQLNL